MNPAHDPAAVLFNTLKPLLPGLPGSAQKLTLTLEGSKPPMIECTYLPEVDGKTEVPVEPITGKYTLVPVGGVLTGEQGAELISLSESAAEALRKYSKGASTQTLTLKIDASEAVAAIRSVLAEALPADVVPGDALAIEPDPRLDEIISLLKRIVAHQECGVMSVVQVIPGE